MSQVALINMPWYSVKLGSIALGVLKRALRRRNIAADIFHFNLRLAARMNLNVYEQISELLYLGDWLFSQQLFGESGTGELRNSYADLLRDPRDDITKPITGINIDFQQIACEIIPSFMDECLESVSWEQYRVVGFSSMFTQHVAALLLARRIKEQFPYIKMVFGGANLEGAMGRETLRAFEWVDYVLDGEGDEVFPQLVSNILNAPLPPISHAPAPPRSDAPLPPSPEAHALPGVSFRGGAQLHFSESRATATSMNRIPVPDYTDYYRQMADQQLLERTSTMLLFESARGCWWGEKSHCTFCGLNGQSMHFRRKSPRRVLREILALASRHEVLDLQAVDNIMDMHYFTSLLPQLAERKLDLHLFYEMKTNLRKEQVRMLRASGVRYLQAGIESLNSDILRMMRKGVTAFQNIQFLKWCKEYGVRVNWNYLYGFPGESGQHYRDIPDTILSVMHLPAPASRTPVIVDRFSPYFTHHADFSIEQIQPAAFYDYIYPAARVRIDQLAFHFNYSPRPEDHAPFRKAVAMWRELDRTRKAYFQYRKGPGLIELIDNRPLSLSEPLTTRRTILRGPEAHVYEACDSGKSFKQIGILPETHLRSMLDRFVENRWMFRENDRYLSLALPPQ